MKPPVYVLRETVLSLHEQLLSEFGGASGIRDEELLNTVLARPAKVFAHGDSTIFELAASYGVGLVKKHPFVDGNKRTGFAVAALFLELNGYRLVANETEAGIHGLAAGEMREADYAAWMEAKSRPV